jgi:hypothetical protein
MDIKLLPYSGQKVLDIDDATAMSFSAIGRALKPYPPGNVRVNGDLWPNGATYHGDVTLAWAHRNRIAQAGWAVVAQDAGSVGSGPEGSYMIEVLVAGSVKRTQTGITSTSFTYTLAQRTADDADLNKPVQFRITPVNGSLSGPQRTTDLFIMQT